MKIMTIYQAFVLGIVQGVTELLPISSSAHLNLIPWILGWNIPESFDVALHFGTLLSILTFFYKDWTDLIKNGLHFFYSIPKRLIDQKNNDSNIGKTKETEKGKMFWYIFLATIPGGTIGFILDYLIGDSLSNMPLLIAIMLIVMGIIMYVIDKKSLSITEYETMSFKQSFLIGLSQAIAFIPGVSRSGITMTMGRMLGVSRKGAAKYSFMLSTPIVLAASIYKLKDFSFDMPFIIGVFTSCIVGLIAIRYLLTYLKKSDFKIFVIYRVIFGLIMILLYITKT